jgi:hypothetical protein
LYLADTVRRGEKRVESVTDNNVLKGMMSPLARDYLAI